LIGCDCSWWGRRIRVRRLLKVSAERTITASTVGDGSAYLDLSGDGSYVSVNGNQVEFTFDGLNEDAMSEFDDILTITVNAGDPSTSAAIANSYDIYFESDTGLGSSSALNFEDQSDDSTLVGSGQAASISYSSGSWDSVTVRAQFKPPVSRAPPWRIAGDRSEFDENVAGCSVRDHANGRASATPGRGVPLPLGRPAAPPGARAALAPTGPGAGDCVSDIAETIAVKREERRELPAVQ